MTTGRIHDAESKNKKETKKKKEERRIMIIPYLLKRPCLETREEVYLLSQLLKGVEATGLEGGFCKVLGLGFRV